MVGGQGWRRRRQQGARVETECSGGGLIALTRHLQLVRLLKALSPIARRSRTPLKRHRITKDGESREALYAPPWEPVADAPMTVDAALGLVEDGLLLKCLKYETDDEVVVVRRVANLDR